MISIKSEEEIEIMKKSGKMTATVMERVLKRVKPGISKAEIDKIAAEEIKSLGGKPSFTTVPNYFWPTCITVNDEVVHGVPNDYILKDRDLVSVDLGVVVSGLHTDMARTIYLGTADSEIERFITTGEKALTLAIAAAVPGEKISQISSTIQKIVEGAGYSVVRAFVGHGVGRELHEDPQIPGFVTRDSGPEIKVGMTLAIEVIYTQGEKDVAIKDDGWTIVTKDGSLAALFEDSVAITKAGAVILTKVN